MSAARVLAFVAACVLLTIFALKCRADVRASENQARIVKSLERIAYAIEDLQQ